MNDREYREAFAHYHPIERRKAFVAGVGEARADEAMARSDVLMKNPAYKRAVYLDAALRTIALGELPE